MMLVWQVPKRPDIDAFLRLSPSGLAQLLCHAQCSHFKLHRQHCCAVRAVS